MTKRVQDIVTSNYNGNYYTTIFDMYGELLNRAIDQVRKKKTVFGKKAQEKNDLGSKDPQ